MTVGPTSGSYAPAQSSRSTEVAPTTEPSGTPLASCGEVVTIQAAGDGRRTGVAVVADPGGLFEYDVASDSVVDLGQDPAVNSPPPKFHGPSLITFAKLREQSDPAHTFGQDSLYELDLATGRATELVRLPDHIRAFEWSPDGAMLAYEVRRQTASELLPESLCLFNARTGATEPIKSIESPFGT